MTEPIAVLGATGRTGGSEDVPRIIRRLYKLVDELEARAGARNASAVAPDAGGVPVDPLQPSQVTAPRAVAGRRESVG